MNNVQLIEKSKNLRKLICNQINRTQGSHIGSMFSCLDILVYLYYNFMNISTKSLNNENRDIFIMSKGHASLAVYTILFDLEIISKAEYESYYSNGSYLTGHMNHKVKGVEFSTGSLGHGLAVAFGIALERKSKKVNAKTICLLGDGECNEGSVWESLLTITKYDLPNLFIVIDANKIQGYDFTKEIVTEKILQNTLKGLGLNYIEVDGHDFEDLQRYFETIPKNNKSSIIFCNTTKGKGVSFMENRLEWHYKSLKKNELKNAICELI